MISDENPRYLIQRIDWRRTRNSSGYPDGPFDWTHWTTIIEFDDVTRETNVTNVLNDCARVTKSGCEFQCFDSVTKEVLNAQQQA